MVKIITDSASDIPDNVAEELDITYVPARVLFGRKAFRDKVDLDHSRFYEMLKTNKYHPTTTQASPLDFYRVFRAAERDGQDIICITLPESLSAFIKSARIAAKYITKTRIEVVNSGGVSGFQGVQVIQAAQMAKQGYSINEIVSQLGVIRDNTRLYSVASTLDYLKRGGRISAARHRLGSTLRVLPIITVVDEVVETADTQALGNMDKALDKVVSMLEKDFSTETPLFGFLLHAQNITGVSVLADKLRSTFNFDSLITTPIGATIGANVGPGAIGVAVAPSFSML